MENNTGGSTELSEILSAIKEMVGHDYLYMDSAIMVKRSPHHQPFNIWALSVSPAGDLYVMDADEQWYPVDPVKDTLLLPSIYQRVKLLRINYARA